jgi:[acyl-carrier-protein] S-malonyltransferase
MEPVAAALVPAIVAAQLHDATIPVISNIHATPITEASVIQEELSQQVATSVQWTRSIEYLSNAGVTVFIEIGPGNALSGMVKRIVKGATLLNIGTAAEVVEAAQTVREMGIL